MAKINCQARMEYVDQKECREYQRASLGEACMACEHCYKNKATYQLYCRLMETEGLLGTIQFEEDG
ncbi:MAG: hypothetical protein IKZ21_01070, partial [Clostridia bacterium]|nr:hypothetical protein [Clostridia bacterium]